MWVARRGNQEEMGWQREKGGREREKQGVGEKGGPVHVWL